MGFLDSIEYALTGDTKEELYAQVLAYEKKYKNDPFIYNKLQTIKTQLNLQGEEDASYKRNLLQLEKNIKVIPKLAKNYDKYHKTILPSYLNKVLKEKLCIDQNTVSNLIIPQLDILNQEISSVMESYISVGDNFFTNKYEKAVANQVTHISTHNEKVIDDFINQNFHKSFAYVYKSLINPYGKKIDVDINEPLLISSKKQLIQLVKRATNNLFSPKKTFIGTYVFNTISGKITLNITAQKKIFNVGDICQHTIQLTKVQNTKRENNKTENGDKQEKNKNEIISNKNKRKKGKMHVSKTSHVDKITLISNKNKEYLKTLPNKTLHSMVNKQLYKGVQASRIEPYQELERRKAGQLKRFQKVSDIQEYVGQGKEYLNVPINNPYIVFTNIGKNRIGINKIDKKYLVLEKNAWETVKKIVNTFRKKRGINNIKLYGTSIFRPVQYNNRLKGSAKYSSHTNANAIDISCTNIYYKGEKDILGKKSKKVLVSVLKSFDRKGLIIYNDETNNLYTPHHHITFTNPSIRGYNDNQPKVNKTNLPVGKIIKTSTKNIHNNMETIEQRKTSFNSRISIIKNNPGKLDSGIIRKSNKTVIKNGKEINLYKKGDPIIFSNSPDELARADTFNSLFETPLFQGLLKNLIFTLEGTTTIINEKKIILTKKYLTKNIDTFVENLKLMILTFYGAESKWVTGVSNPKSNALGLFQWLTNNAKKIKNKEGKVIIYKTNSYETGLNSIRKLLNSGLAKKLSPNIIRIIDNFMPKNKDGTYKMITKKTHLKPNTDIQNGAKKQQMVLSLLYTFAYTGKGKYGDKEILKNQYLAQLIHGGANWEKATTLFYNKLHHTNVDYLTKKNLEYQIQYFSDYTKKIDTENIILYAQEKNETEHNNFIQLLEKELHPNNLTLGKITKEYKENLKKLNKRIKQKGYTNNTTIAKLIINGLKKARQNRTEQQKLLSLIIHRGNNWELETLISYI